MTNARRVTRLYTRYYPQLLIDLLTVAGCCANALAVTMPPAYAVWIASILAAGLGAFGSWALAKRARKEAQ